jgi:hypothetical protein
VTFPARSCSGGWSRRRKSCSTSGSSRQPASSTEEELEAQIAAADREALEERRDAIARGELKGRALTDIAEEARIEQEAAEGATEAPAEEER